MKNFVLSAVLFAASVVAVHAQESYKPEIGSFGVELEVSPFLGVVGFQQGLQFDENIAGQIKGFYVLDQKIGVRLGLGFGRGSGKEDNGESGDDHSKQKISVTSFSILPGITYSFEGTERLAPYVGAEFAIGSCSTKEINTEGKIKETIKNEGDELFNTFGLNVFTGFNYYFAKNLYVGVEAGIGYDFVKLKHEKEKVKGMDGWKAPEKPKDSVTGSFFGFKVNPILRLGWTF